MIVRRCLWWLPLMCLCAIPAAAQQPPPAPPTQAVPSVGGAGIDTSPGPFEPVPKQVEVGARLTTMSGDPARVQRYQNVRDGLLFTSLRFGRGEETGFGTSVNVSSISGYADHATNRDFRIVESTAEYVLRFGARRAPSSCEGLIDSSYHTVVRR